MPPLRFVAHAFAGAAETVARRLTGRALWPGWSFSFEVVVSAMRRNFLYGASLPVAEARRFNEAMVAAIPLRQPVERTAQVLGGVPVVRFTPRGQAPQRLLIYLHGGSYLMGSANTHAPLIARLALEGFVVLAVEYRLAPEHSVMDACADACAVIAAAQAEGWAPSELALAGDSAGGALAYLACVALREGALAQPAAIAAISPWVDLACPGASMEQNERWDWGTAAALRGQGRLAAGSLALDDPRLSPTFADLRGLPPTLVHVGELEVLRDSVVAFAARLQAAGVAARLVRWPDMVHDFHIFADQEQRAREAIAQLAAFLRQHTRERPTALG